MSLSDRYSTGKETWKQGIAELHLLELVYVVAFFPYNEQGFKVNNIHSAVLQHKEKNTVFNLLKKTRVWNRVLVKEQM